MPCIYQNRSAVSRRVCRILTPAFLIFRQGKDLRLGPIGRMVAFNGPSFLAMRCHPWPRFAVQLRPKVRPLFGPRFGLGSVVRSGVPVACMASAGSVSILGSRATVSAS